LADLPAPVQPKKKSNALKRVQLASSTQTKDSVQQSS